jgi:hypothetical protein
MITLGSIILSDNTVLLGLDADTVSVNTQRSDEGVAQILLATIEGGRQLELDGLFSIAQENAILELAKTKAPQPLVHPRFTGSVFIVGTDMQNWTGELVDPLATEERIGIIKLIEA